MGGCNPCAISDEEEKYSDWRVRDAVDCLMRAEDIKQDAKMMGLVKKEIDKKVKSVKQVSSLKELRNVASQKSDEVDAEKEET